MNELYSDKFAEEIKQVFSKYVSSASVVEVTLNDGSRIGMRRLILYALGHIRHLDSQID